MWYRTDHSWPADLWVLKTVSFCGKHIFYFLWAEKKSDTFFQRSGNNTPGALQSWRESVHRQKSRSIFWGHFLFPSHGTRLHPQDKGGPQASDHFVWTTLKNVKKNANTTTIRIQKSTVFERSAIYQPWTFFIEKVCLIVGMFLQNWPILRFHLSKDALTAASKNRVRGTSTRWQNFKKSVRRRRRTDTRF